MHPPAAMPRADGNSKIGVGVDWDY